MTKITCAAIWYQEEQNEPSVPFVLVLDVEELSKANVEKALLAHPDVAASLAENKRYADRYPEDPVENPVWEWDPYVGDVSLDIGPMVLFVSFPVGTEVVDVVG